MVKFRKRKLHKKVHHKKRSKMTMFKKPNSEQIYRQRVEVSVAVVNTTGALLSLAYSFSLLFPTMYRSPANTIAQMPIVPTNFARAYIFFDMYRVRTCRFRFEPNLVNVGITGTPTVDVPVSVYIITDHDDNALNNEVGLLNDGQHAIPYSRGNIVRRSMKPLKGQSFWINTSNLGPAGLVASYTAATPLTNANLAPINPLASIKALFNSITPTTDIGRIFIEYDVEWRGTNFV